MGTYAQNTEVSQEKSRAEIETTLRRYGADAFSYGWEDGRAMIAFRAQNRHIRFVISMPDRNDPKFWEYRRGTVPYRRSDDQAYKLWEQASRQRWRALALVVKAKLEAVDAGISEFEEEFLAHIVLPDGSTVGQQIRPAIEQAYVSGKMPKLLLGTGEK
ncbi:MAG TPA: hypothetical protein VGO43_09845 [Pyrinomonadaceae bacterium]|jgi:hypothetical protein|nr:hypothetical protein [Pyrinomonadaceae bacterium]